MLARLFAALVMGMAVSGCATRQPSPLANDRVLIVEAHDTFRLDGKLIEGRQALAAELQRLGTVKPTITIDVVAASDATDVGEVEDLIEKAGLGIAEPDLAPARN